jgi:DNA topoisomerase VI subunit B
MTISETILPEFDNEMANTRKTLERVPDDKFDWKPHPKSFAMGPLAIQ